MGSLASTYATWWCFASLAASTGTVPSSDERQDGFSKPVSRR